MKKLVSIIFVATLLLTSSRALADARSQARRFFQQGIELLKKGELTEAIESFVSANEILPHPDVQYNIARACNDAKRYTEAIYWYNEYLKQDSPPSDKEEVLGIIETLTALSTPKQSTASISPAQQQLEQPPPQDIQEQIERLRKTADDIAALSPTRSKELREIADKYSRLARLPSIVTSEKNTKAQDPPQNIQKEETKPKQPAEVRPTPSPEVTRTIEDYEEQEIITAVTGNATTRDDAPAVVWILTQQDIRHRGYRTVSEMLQNVAGLHVIDNQVFVDVGIRGVHEGLRGQARLIKVLIDGQPTSFRLTSGNMLGLEMIPIRAIDRVELIRGPASALYGANAFSGVLQIITRRGSDVRGGSIAAVTGSNTQSAAGTTYSANGDLILGTKSGNFSFFGAGSFGRIDRSGLELPATSPLSSALPAFSQEDISVPASVFARLAIQLDKETSISLDGGLQRLRSRAEWLDYAPLTGFNQVALDNAWARLSFDTVFQSNFKFNVFAAYTSGSTAEGNRYRPLRTGASGVSTAYHIEDRLKSDAFNTKAELQWNVSPRIRLRFGGDFEVDIETLEVPELVFTENVGVYRIGDRAPAVVAQQDTNQVFANSGFYTQIEAEPIDWFNGVGGFRFDYNNRFGASINGRVGTVFKLFEGVTVKALYGSSFRAPTPDQQFHEAAYIGDTIGCQNFGPCNSQGLAPQTAQTGELVAGFNVRDLLKIQLTGYLSYINELILSFPTQGGLFVTTNAGSYLSNGIEAEISGELPASISDFIVTRLSAQLSLNDTLADIPESQFQPPETIRAEFREQSLFPQVSGGISLDLAIPSYSVGLYVEGRYIGTRRPSGSNLALGEYENGELPGFFEMDMNLSTRDLYLFSKKETVISLRATNILGQAGVEGGFRGWDIPRMGRSVYLRLIQEF
ncbi:MAG: TonB-dependent receptor [Myxococcota bacterium]|nr:TonB-dependent receptor [Myxococcota bacterium]